MKKLTKSDMKQLMGGLLPPNNGVCYDYGENCNRDYQCCPNTGLSCVGDVGKKCDYLIEID